jgi:hypothetical protein
MGVSNYDFEMLSKDDMDELVSIFLMARERAREIIATIPLREESSNTADEADHDEQPDLF